MTDGAERIFRASALQRAASPEQLDHLVSVTRPFDWILIVCHLSGAGRSAWLGHSRPNSVTYIGPGHSGRQRSRDRRGLGRGRDGSASIGVSVGDHVTPGQTIAQIAQTDIEQRHRSCHRSL